jgi:hypothetical protein
MQEQNLGDYAKRVIKDFAESKASTGKTYSIRYGRTVNLGHYESCRIELEQLCKAGMRRIYDREKFLKRPLWPKTKEEIRERLYKIRPYLQGQY